MTGATEHSSSTSWAHQQWTRVRQLAPRRSDWTSVRLGRDLPAGLMVGLVALPLALGFQVSSGMGATAGLVTAVVAGAFAAIFGGSKVQVSGPTGAMTVVLVPIIATHGANGVLVVGLLAGLILVGLGYAGAGRFIRYVPVPVVEGFRWGSRPSSCSSRSPPPSACTSRPRRCWPRPSGRSVSGRSTHSGRRSS